MRSGQRMAGGRASWEASMGSFICQSPCALHAKLLCSWDSRGPRAPAPVPAVGSARLGHQLSPALRPPHRAPPPLPHHTAAGAQGRVSNKVPGARVEAQLLPFPCGDARGLLPTEVVRKVNELIATGRYGRLFAVVHFASHQWKVTAEDLILIENELDLACGERIRLEKVRLGFFMHSGTRSWRGFLRSGWPRAKPADGRESEEAAASRAAQAGLGRWPSCDGRLGATPQRRRSAVPIDCLAG